MGSTVRRLARASTLYTGALLVSGGISFGLIAVFTRFLSPSDFGVLALLTATQGVLGAAVGLNPTLFFTAKFPALDRADLRRYGGAALLATLVTAALAYVILEGLGLWLEAFQLPHWVLAGLAVLGVVVAVRGLGLTVLKMRERPVPYAAAKVGESALTGGIGVALVVVLAFDWRGKYLGQLLAGLAVAVVLGAYLVRTRQIGLQTTRTHLREYVQFSLPVVPHSLGFWAINAQDRYFVVAMSGLEAAGIYSVGYTLARILEVANQGVLHAFSPHFYGRLEKGEGKDGIVLMTYGYLVFAVLGFVAFVLVMEYVVPVFVGPQFVDSARFVPWVAAGYTFNAIRNFMTGYLYVAERTDVLAGLTVGAAVLNAALNYVLILWVGAVGAAIATAVTFAALGLVTTYLATKLYDMPWREAIMGLMHRSRGPEQ